MSDPGVLDIKEGTIKLETPVSQVLESEIMRLASENNNGQHSGEINTFKRLKEDLGTLTLLENPLNDHFTNVAPLVEQRVSKFGEDKGRAIAYIQDVGRYRVDRGVNLTPEPSTFRKRDNMNRIALIPRLKTPDDIKKLADFKDGNIEVTNGNELGLSADGQFAYLSPETYRMVVDTYIRSSKGAIKT